MSRRLLLCSMLLLCAGQSSSFAQAPVIPASTPPGPRVHSLSVSAEAVDASELPAGSSGAASPPHPLFIAPKVRVTMDTDSVKVTVRNFGPVPDTAHVEWYFVAVAVGVDATGQDYILAQDTKDIPLPAGGTETFPVASPVVEVTEKLPTASRMKKSLVEREKGSTLRGWFVRIVADGKIISARGSNQTYEDTAKDEAKLEALKAVPPPKMPRKRKS